MELEIYRKGIETPIVVDVDDFIRDGETTANYLSRVLNDRSAMGIGRRLCSISADADIDLIVLAGADIGNMETR